jgi:hypothetical protein
MPTALTASPSATNSSWHPSGCGARSGPRFIDSNAMAQTGPDEATTPLADFRDVLLASGLLGIGQKSAQGPQYKSGRQ